ncbi:Hypothetical predicted protein [Cloeon dipterum]|uniref:Uncharacterized protein n=1 Tax=Cloeon dipterum TaxID=197152 RepID=A0A8S1DTL1_9INSE|nr:Hypothetical predicted protein [Cloeon dipterum]
MEFVPRLEHAKKICRLLGSVNKLENLATETILNNLATLTQQQGVKSIQKILSPPLRENVLQELLATRRPGQSKSIEEFNCMKQSVLVLINTRTKKLDLDLLMSFFPESNSKNEFYEVLMMISIAAPNVQHLKMNIKDLQDCFACNIIKSACIRYLSSLKELKILEIVGDSSHSVDYALLCRELRNLRVLSANYFDGRSMSEEEIRKSFGNLKLLEYGCMTISKVRQIGNVLPDLHIVRNFRGLNGITLEKFIANKKFLERRNFPHFNNCLSNLYAYAGVRSKNPFRYL